jgi:competence protein ComEA
MRSTRRLGVGGGAALASLAWMAGLGATVFFLRRPMPAPIEIVPPPTAPPTATAAPTATPGPLTVDVVGAVRLPGVYLLPPGSAVIDAIAAAGGAAPDAELDRINKAVALADRMQVYVPRRGEEPPPSPIAPQPPLRMQGATIDPPADTGQVDLNRCSAVELEALPGIGPKMAARIIAGRPYRNVADLLKVDGIGDATLEKLRALVIVQ